MKRCILSLVLLTTALPVVAGEVYGTVTENAKSVGAGVKIGINLGGNIFNTATDSNGSYRLFVPTKGRAELKVYLRGQAPGITVFSSEGSVRYDLAVAKRGGQLVLERN